MFPSPYGEDKGFIKGGHYEKANFEDFRPLTGKIKVLFKVCGGVLVDAIHFRPLTGKIKVL